MVTYGPNGPVNTEEEIANYDPDWNTSYTPTETPTPIDPTLEKLKKIEEWLQKLVSSSATGVQYKLNTNANFNLDKLATSIISNLGYLDSKTADYLRTIPEQYRKQAVMSMLGNQTVVTGVSRTVAENAAKDMGMVLTDMSGSGAFSVGGYIFVLGTTQDSDDLLGHEAIHGLQSIAAGGPVQFLEKYNHEAIVHGTTRNPVDNINVIQHGSRNIDVDKAYYLNRFERAAYSWGPVNQDATTNLSNPLDCLEWWK